MRSKDNAVHGEVLLLDEGTDLLWLILVSSIGLFVFSLDLSNAATGSSYGWVVNLVGLGAMIVASAVRVVRIVVFRIEAGDEVELRSSLGFRGRNREFCRVVDRRSSESDGFMWVDLVLDDKGHSQSMEFPARIVERWLPLGARVIATAPLFAHVDAT